MKYPEYLRNNLGRLSRYRRGSRQARSPSRERPAGSSTPRTIVASMSTAAAMVTPNSLNSISPSVAKMENTATMIAAALVTTPALDEIPSMTDALGELPARRSHHEFEFFQLVATLVKDRHVGYHSFAGVLSGVSGVLAGCPFQRRIGLRPVPSGLFWPGT